MKQVASTRVVYLGKTARNALWRYLAEREDGEDPNAPLFVVREGRPFHSCSMMHIIKSIAARADVKNAHPHKFAILEQLPTCDLVEMFSRCNRSWDLAVAMVMR